MDYQFIWKHNILVVLIGSEMRDLGLKVHTQVSDSRRSLSQDLVCVLEDYQATHSWVFLIIDKCPEATSFSVESLFPKLKQDRAVKMLATAMEWVEAQDVSAFDVKEVR